MATDLTIAFVAIQFVPYERSNPLGAGDPVAAQDVQWVLRRACYNCHSNETRWPVWAYVAPISWHVVADVRRARRVLNFSEWQGCPPPVRVAMRSLVNPVVATHRMPGGLTCRSGARCPLERNLDQRKAAYRPGITAVQQADLDTLERARHVYQASDLPFVLELIYAQ